MRHDCCRFGTRCCSDRTGHDGCGDWGNPPSAGAHTGEGSTGAGNPGRSEYAATGE